MFALFNVIGTPNNLAIWDDTEEQCVPNLYTGTGSPEWGDPEHQWTIGSLPAYTTETLIYADYVKENLPEAKVAILSQNDDFGKPYVDTFKSAIEGTDVEIVAEETYESSNTDVVGADHQHRGRGSRCRPVGHDRAGLPERAQRRQRRQPRRPGVHLGHLHVADPRRPGRAGCGRRHHLGHQPQGSP